MCTFGSNLTPKMRCAIAYVDGSYSPEINKFSYGVVLFVNAMGLDAGRLYRYSENRVNDCDTDGLKFHFSKAFKNPELLEMRNIAGEIMGAGEAIKVAAEMGCRKITIFHDYEGISKWCTGEWKAKQKWTKKYKEFYDEMREKIDIEFVKVTAHQAKTSGTDAFYNNEADALARGALGI